MPEIRYYVVRQTREVRVRVEVKHPDDSYEAAAIEASDQAFSHPTEPELAMAKGVVGLPTIVHTEILKTRA